MVKVRGARDENFHEHATFLPQARRTPGSDGVIFSTNPTNVCRTGCAAKPRKFNVESAEARDWRMMAKAGAGISLVAGSAGLLGQGRLRLRAEQPIELARRRKRRRFFSSAAPEAGGEAAGEVDQWQEDHREHDRHDEQGGRGVRPGAFEKLTYRQTIGNHGLYSL